MNRLIGSIAVLAAALFTSFPLQAHEPVPLDRVPPAVMKSVKARIPGINVTKAMYEMEGKDRIYTLEGKAGNREYAIVVASRGVILEVYNKDYYEKNIED